MKKIDKETKKGIIIWFYVLSVPILVAIWFDLIFQCFSIYSTDYICEIKNRVKENIFYLLAVIWLFLPVIIKFFKRSVRFGITIVSFILVGFIMLIYASYYRSSNDVDLYIFTSEVRSSCINHFSEVIYKDKNNKNSGIYSCDNFVFFKETSGGICNYSDFETPCLKYQYAFGYTYDSTIEKEFSGFPYFYYSQGGNEKDLRIALTAESEDDLVESYNMRLYKLIQELSKYNNSIKIHLSIYYNNSFEDIYDTYDKLFLNADINSKKQLLFGKKYFGTKKVKKMIKTISLDSNYPDNARKALIDNRHISVVIEKPQDISIERLETILKKSFVKYDN